MRVTLLQLCLTLGNPMDCSLGFPGSKEPTYQCRRHKRSGLDPWVGKIPWRRTWQTTPVFLPGEFHGWRSLGTTVHGVTKSQTWLKWISMHAWIVAHQAPLSMGFSAKNTGVSSHAHLQGRPRQVTFKLQKARDKEKILWWCLHNSINL